MSRKRSFYNVPGLENSSLKLYSPEQIYLEALLLFQDMQKQYLKTKGVSIIRRVFLFLFNSQLLPHVYSE